MPLSRKTMKLAVRAAQGAAMALAKTIRAVRGSFSFPVTASTKSITMPGTIYPMGDSAPILPTIPSASASPLCTAPIIVAQPKRGTKTAATTRNIREKEVPIPPGMCSASVNTLAKGPITFLANRPRSQHSARKIRVLRRVDFIRHSPFGKNKSVSFLEKKNTHAGTTPRVNICALSSQTRKAASFPRQLGGRWLPRPQNHRKLRRLSGSKAVKGFTCSAL